MQTKLSPFPSPPSPTTTNSAPQTPGYTTTTSTTAGVFISIAVCLLLTVMVYSSIPLDYPSVRFDVWEIVSLLSVSKSKGYFLPIFASNRCMFDEEHMRSSPVDKRICAPLACSQQDRHVVIYRLVLLE